MKLNFKLKMTKIINKVSKFNKIISYRLNKLFNRIIRKIFKKRSNYKLN